MNLTQSVKDNFKDYAAETIQRRALVNVFDGLKPSARQVFYALHQGKVNHKKEPISTIKAIGIAMLYYTHGDASLTGIIMRAGQPFSTRYPLIDIRGSYGDLVEAGNWSHPRYNYSKLSEIASYMFKNIEKDTIDLWFDNYDNTDRFPSVLPCLGFWPIVQGSMGIGIALSSSIPAFNLKEMNQALVNMLWDKPYTLPMPDFATGATLINKKEVEESLLQGTGKSARIHATIDYDVKGHELIVTEIPPLTYTNKIAKELEDLITNDPECGFDRFLDVTGETPKIRIYLTKRANPQRIIEKLYKETSLENYYAINMVMLEGGSPKVFSLPEAMAKHLQHELECYTKAFTYDLRQLRNRLHIVEGYILVCAQIEEVVRVIKQSHSQAEANVNLTTHFTLSEIQATAILKMTLARITSLEVEKFIKEKNNLLDEIQRVVQILDNKTLLKKEVEKGLVEVANKFGDARRTAVVDLKVNEEEEVILDEEKKLVVTLSNHGFILPLEVDNFNKQQRGGRGFAIKLKKNDFIVETLYTSTHDNLMLMSNLGKSYSLKVGNLVLGESTSLHTILQLAPEESIVKVVNFNKTPSNFHVTIVTRNGLIKKTAVEEYRSRKKDGLIGIKLREGDQVAAVLVSAPNDEVFIATRNGKCVRYPLSDIGEIGRVTQGIKGITLGPKDWVIGAVNFGSNEAQGIVFVTEKGVGKLSNLDEYGYTNRVSRGIYALKLKEDSLAKIALQHNATSDIIVATSTNLIRFPIAQLRSQTKDTIGSTIIKLNSNSKILFIGQVI